MKLLKDCIRPFLARSCVICVAISYLFFIFAQTLKEDVLAITFSQYLLLFVFSLLLSASGFIFRIPLAKPILVAIHYVATALIFFITFTSAGKLSFPTTASLFVAIALFTVVYAVIYAVYALGKHLFKRFVPKENKEKKAAEPPVYEKRF